jgi:type VI secretion system protein ImpC
MPQQDLPLDLVVLADLGLPAGHAAIGRVHRLEPDSFAAFMADARPEATVGTGAAAVKLAFTEPRSFRPEALATQLPDVRALLELRQKVSQRGLETRELEAMIAGLPDGSPLKAGLQSVVRGPAGSGAATTAGTPAGAAPPPPSAPPAPPAPPAAPTLPQTGSGSDALDAIFDMVDVSGSAAPPAPGDERPVTPAARALDKLVGLLGAGGRGQAGSSTLAGLAAVVDEAMSDSLRAVLADPAFRALEQTWTGLRFLIRRIDVRTGVRLFVLPTTRALLAGHARDVYEPFAEEQRREPRVVVALADFDLAGDADGLALAAALAAVAAENQSPLIAAADTALLGIESLAGIESIENVDDLLADDAHAGWRELRADEDSRWLALTANRFLMRLPYGAEADRVKGFAFEENPADREPGYLWGRGVWAIGVGLAASYAHTGWGVRLTGQDEETAVGDLPVRLMRLKTGEIVPAPLEALLSERRALEFSQGGVIALLCRRGGDFAFLASAPVVHRSAMVEGAPQSSAEARRNSLPFAMFVAQVTAWVAHLDGAGRFDSDEERRMTLARGVQFLSMTGDGATIEAAVEGDSIRITPWRDPLRGLPDFTMKVSGRG